MLKYFPFINFTNQTCTEIPNRANQTPNKLNNLLSILWRRQVDSLVHMWHETGNVVVALTELALIMKNNHKSECGVAFPCRGGEQWEMLQKVALACRDAANTAHRRITAIVIRTRFIGYPFSRRWTWCSSRFDGGDHKRPKSDALPVNIL